MSLQSRIFPVLLIRDGGLVKTRQFTDERYVGDPMNAVKIFNEKEVDELAIFDIDATINRRGPDFKVLEKIAVESRMPLAYGGGVSTAKQAAELVKIGYEKVSISSACIERPGLVAEVAERVGRQSVVVTVDVKKEGLLGGHNIYTHNGTRKCGTKLAEFLPLAEKLGAGEICINSIDKDGMQSGYDVKLAKLVRHLVSTPISFVGGAGSKADIATLIEAVGVVGAGAGSMFVFKGPYRAVLISYEKPSS